MRFVVASLVGKTVLLGGLLACGVVTLFASVSFAQSGTTVNANVCGLSQTANIVINTPLSGTRTSTQIVIVTGSLAQITQLTAYLDGKFSEIIPIDSGATTFSYEYMPPVGKHTLRLEGQDLCQRTTPVAELILTYNPALPPKPITGPAVTIPAADNAAGHVPERAPPQDSSQPIDATNVPMAVLPNLLQPIGNGIADALAGLGIISKNPAQSVSMATRFAVMTTGVLVVTLAGGAVRLGALFLPAAIKNSFLSTASPWLVAHGRLVVSVAGIALIVIGFLLPS